MPRSRTPKKTIQKILDISLKLFNTHGFVEVKMQDIVDKLAAQGLSKGAIYHHFRNKEEILEEILARYEHEINNISHIGLYSSNSRDKLKGIILRHFSLIIAHKVFIRNSREIFGSSLALAYRLRHNTHICPILESIIEEGNADASLNVAYPKAASEMLFWAMYVWLDNVLYPLQQNEYIHKLRHLRIMCEGVGLSLIDEDFNMKALEVWRELML
ncbi:TetR/AcrR family transcriptional regulator [Helicobacter marmotae]|uniref:TetR/AcrR family transcriptional regulator n=1 Tax=Helicobacter marmotae TaxID=152490 RepID=A0A3D8I594_9HELI|nr:TetR/AcrR family transcriptional regulator [Helicobacter marmotae]RDU60330.1 TetR/AcrR family transcriptional regulator [Helicobacter marmotae]